MILLPDCVQLIVSMLFKSLSFDSQTVIYYSIKQNNKTGTKASNGNKKPADNDLFYMPIQQLAKSANINYDFNDNSNERFNFEQV